MFERLTRGLSGTPGELIRKLRTEWIYASLYPDTFLHAVGQLKFSRGDEAEHEVSHTKDNVKRSLRAEMSGESELPESIRVSFAPYPGLMTGDWVSLTCNVVVSASEGTLALVASPAAIAGAQVDAIARLLGRVSEQVGDITVIAGAP